MNYNGFCPKLSMWYLESYDEKKIKKKDSDINEAYAIYPMRFYKTVNEFSQEKIYDFIFIGAFLINDRTYKSRKWIIHFINKKFNQKSYLQFTDNITKTNYIPKGSFDYTLKEIGFVPRENELIDRNQFDKNYFEKMCKSKFCLCPGGDEKWSMRFYEALLCKTIPIVSEVKESYRSKEEALLGYKFYLTTDKNFIYRKDWVEHNYNLFIKYHTLEYLNI